MARNLPLVLLAGLSVAALAIFAGLIASGRAVDLPFRGTSYIARVELPRAGEEGYLPEIAGGEDRDVPLVVIDPGHGGHDPGASSATIEEKSLVLALARSLRDELLEQGDVRVALTRSDDRYLLHAERVAIARQLGADLFLSIHADSAGDATEVVGASIYTLSERASSEAARRFAERENRADRINGQDMAGQSDTVSSILVELSQRRTQEQSAEFAALIEREGQGIIDFHPQAKRSAALKVLRAPDVPSVLYESGFITNDDEARRLASEEGRQRFADVLARAVRIFLIRQNTDLLASPAGDTAPG